MLLTTEYLPHIVSIFILLWINSLFVTFFQHTVGHHYHGIMTKPSKNPCRFVMNGKKGSFIASLACLELLILRSDIRNNRTALHCPLASRMLHAWPSNTFSDLVHLSPKAGAVHISLLHGDKWFEKEAIKKLSSDKNWHENSALNTLNCWD